MIRVGELLAEINFRPKAWQSTSPLSITQHRWNKPPVRPSADFMRIAALVRRDPYKAETAIGQGLIELMQERLAIDSPNCNCKLLHNSSCRKQLRFVQAWCLFELSCYGGILGPIGVGHGKTMLDILAPMAVSDCKHAVLLVPPGLVNQLILEYELLAQHFKVPSLFSQSPKHPYSHNIGAPALHVLPYSILSRPAATTILNSIKPDLIIADEAHKLRHADTATTARVLRYMAANPDTRFCCWSGSITDSSIKDYAHLSAMSLKEASPLPIDPNTVTEWSGCIDPGDDPTPAGVLLELCEPGESVRDGFRRRLLDSPGVVTTSEPAIDATLVITEQPAPELPYEVREALSKLESDMVRPDGEELVDNFAVARCAYQLACGFYYRWVFPRKEPTSLIEEWLDVRADWNRELRAKLKVREEHLDSEDLCKRAAMRYHGDAPANKDLPEWRSTCWPAWRDIRDKVYHETRPVRLHPFLAKDSADWANKNLGVVWYEHHAFGAWVAEIGNLELHGGGPEAEKRIMGISGQASIVASIKSHGTGRNGLQYHYNDQLIANPPSSSTAWEQLLGRLHRIGQEKKEVFARFYRHTQSLQNHIDQALSRALYVDSTLGGSQKLRVGWSLTKGD